MPSLQHGSPESSSSSPRRRHHGHGASKSFADAESSPLLAGPSTPVERHSTESLDPAFEAIGYRIRDTHQLAYHSSDESNFFDFIMEKVKSTKFAHLVDKLAVDSEPGLTNAQLMYDCSILPNSFCRINFTNFSSQAEQP
jgi:NCS1 family nucleobase:cation symporter-1